MAIPTCGKCGGTLFEVVQQEPLRSEFKLMFVQCSSCGNVVGVLDYFNIGQLLHELAEKLGVSL